jgi:hypothetical protein
MKLIINWTTEIPNSNIGGLENVGEFSILKNNKLLLAINELTKEGFHKKGRLVQISNDNVQHLFETDYSLGVYSSDGDYIYLVSCEPHSLSYNPDDKSDVLFKLDNLGELMWQYQLDGKATSLPLVTEDSIFITDFNFLNTKANLLRFDKNGNLLLKQPLEAYTYRPLIVPGRHEIILSYHKPRLEIRDFEGRIIVSKSIDAICDIPFSINRDGDIFGAINNSIAAMDNGLNILWEYKPAKGRPYIAPVFDFEGNLYSRMNYNRLVSLDPKGNEKWITEIYDDGNQPFILSSGNIMVLTSHFRKRKMNGSSLITHMEIFSPKGQKLMDDELPGGIFHVVEDKNNIFMVSSSLNIKKNNESVIHSTKVFSLSFC